VRQGDPRVTVGTGRARVTLRLDRFGMQVKNGDAVVLDTLDTTADTPADTSRPFGALGATHRNVSIRPPQLLGDGWDRATLVDDPWVHGTTVSAARVEGNTATIDLCDPAHVTSPLRVTVTVLDDEVRVEARASARSGSDAGAAGDAGASALDRFGQTFTLPADEHFFGLGERYVTVDHRGQKFENWVEEAGFSQGESVAPGRTNPYPNGIGMTHMPVPFVLSSKGYGLWVETTARSGFDLGASNPTAWRVYMDDAVLRYRVLVHDDPRASLDHFTRLTGRAHAPAPWVFAPRRRVDPNFRIGGVPEPEALRRRGVPTTMLDDSTHFLPDVTQAGREGELRARNQGFHEWGYKVIGYFTPYVSAEREAAGTLLAYGRANNLFVKLATGADHTTTIGSNGWQRVSAIDMTNPAAVTWWGTLLQTALDMGYDGWMLDFGEYIPYEARMHDGRRGWEAHNDYPVAVARATYEYLRRVRNDDFMFFVRSGYTGTQAVTPMVWSGDPTTAFDDARGLPSSVRAGLNAGLSGIPFWGSDISGYTCLNVTPADKEVYLRWTEFGAFSPDMHDENACEGAADDAPPKWTLWSDAETTEVYGRYARLHTRLVPYIHAAAREAEQTGMPIMRHPILMHPREPEAWMVQYEYGFGPALYVAPVVRRAVRSHTFWLPPGQWVDWWTLAATDGGRRVTREAPLDLIPLYQRAGTIIPMLDPRVETLVADQRDDVTSAAEVADVMDARAVVRATDPRVSATLGDGAAFEAQATDRTVTLPTGYTMAATEAELATCARCGRIEMLTTGGTRVRLTSESAMTATVSAASLTLTHRAPRTMRVRWDVIVL
jgi:alpha-glucosidase (family GH31 glycosyl hydrolase)